MAVDISRKTPVEREALAQGTIILQTATIQRIKEKTVDKGDVIELSRAAAVHGVKQTPLMLLLCHPIPIHSVKVDFDVLDTKIQVSVHVKSEGRTGCEMDALNGAANALLTIWDMVKMYEKDSEGQYPATTIQDLKVVRKVKRSLR
ncbi:MAG TPA: cyclic pyranopterin monophosphate synthase MoaC [Candidatus Hodarchaeales archaeon]|nr:cyclic pyranopterin monophosphate synthase MoaC [Candidatus Hodarchaeales archaeon]